MNVKPLIKIEKNLAIGIPEIMQVVFDGIWYFVQVWSEEKNVWVIVAVHKDAKSAIADCYNWYCGDF